MQVFVHQFQWLGDMIAVGNNDPRIIFLYRYYHRLAILQWINFFPIHHSPYPQEAEQHLVLSLQYYVKRSGYCLGVMSYGLWVMGYESGLQTVDY